MAAKYRWNETQDELQQDRGLGKSGGDHRRFDGHRRSHCQAFCRPGRAASCCSRAMPARAEAARGRIGHTEQTLALSCDVRNREEIDRVVSLTLHHFQRIDVWINNAGHGLMDTAADVDMTACRETFDTNFFGTVACMQAALAVMKQQGSGTIINISSVAGHIPLPFHSVYSATKFAMNAFGKAARRGTERLGYPCDDGVSGIRAHRFQRQCHQRERSQDGKAVRRSAESVPSAWPAPCCADI